MCWPQLELFNMMRLWYSTLVKLTVSVHIAIARWTAIVLGRLADFVTLLLLRVAIGMHRATAVPTHWARLAQLLSLVNEISRWVCGVEILDESRKLCRILRVCHSSHVHLVVCANQLLVFTCNSFSCLLVKGRIDRAWSTIGHIWRETGQLIANRSQICNVVLQVVLHNRCIGALR